MKTLVIFAISIVMFSGKAIAQQITVRDSVIEKAVLQISASNIKTTVNELVALHTRHNLSTKIDPAKGIGAATQYLSNKLNGYIKSSAGRAIVEKIEYRAGAKDTRLGREITLTNVVATFKGSNKEDNRIIVLLAHYDSRADNNSDSTAFAPGANDNGSGVAALLEIARILSGMETPVTIKLMFLSGEEHGLLGAAFMASVAKKENWNIIGVLNNDMIGNSRSSSTDVSNNTKLRVFSENIPYVESDDMKKSRVFNSSENDSKSRQLARYIKETGERYVDNMEVKLIYRNDRFGRGGDHTPFCKEGFTAVRICEYHENYDRTHQPVTIKNGIELGDMPNGVDFEYVRKNCGVNLSSLLNLSFAPSLPQNVKIDISDLSNNTKISWESPKEGKKPSAYYILIRETDKSNWERKVKIKGNNIELPLSKDNYLFAVQSVDSEGHESLSVFAIGGSSK